MADVVLARRPRRLDQPEGLVPGIRGGGGAERGEALDSADGGAPGPLALNLEVSVGPERLGGAGLLALLAGAGEEVVAAKQEPQLPDHHLPVVLHAVRVLDTLPEEPERVWELTTRRDIRLMNQEHLVIKEQQCWASELTIGESEVWWIEKREWSVAIFSPLEKN